MKEISELQELIIEWAKEKNIDNPENQYLKILEEVGETTRAILKKDTPEIFDGLGDIAVTVIIYYWQMKRFLITEPEMTENVNRDAYNFSTLSEMIIGGNQSVFYPLADISLNHQTTLKECLNLAWNVIKSRQGKTVNGTFIKN